MFLLSLSTRKNSRYFWEPPVSDHQGWNFEFCSCKQWHKIHFSTHHSFIYKPDAMPHSFIHSFIHSFWKWGRVNGSCFLGKGVSWKRDTKSMTRVYKGRSGLLINTRYISSLCLRLWPNICPAMSEYLEFVGFEREQHCRHHQAGLSDITREESRAALQSKALQCKWSTADPASRPGLP